VRSRVVGNGQVWLSMESTRFGITGLEEMGYPEQFATLRLTNR